MADPYFGFDAERAFEYENGFSLTSALSRIGKLLGQYEVYQRITGLPGEIVECGVYKAASLLRLLSLREAPDSRKLSAFDAFGRFPRTNDRDDNVWLEGFEREGATAFPWVSSSRAPGPAELARPSPNTRQTRARAAPLSPSSACS